MIQCKTAAGQWFVRKRFSEFRALKEQLSSSGDPALKEQLKRCDFPRKTVGKKTVSEKRGANRHFLLQNWLNVCIVPNASHTFVQPLLEEWAAANAQADVSGRIVDARTSGAPAAQRRPVDATRLCGEYVVTGQNR